MRRFLPGDTLAPASVRQARQSRTTVVLQPWGGMGMCELAVGRFAFYRHIQEADSSTDMTPTEREEAGS